MSDFRSEGFVAVADDGGYSGKRGEFFGNSLCVATCGNDAGLRVLAMSAADVGAGFAVGFGSDAAGVDDDHIGFGGQALSRSGTVKQRGYGLSIGASSATAEVLNVEGNGHRFSLLEQRG
jgi:hypothetical protein